MPTVDEELLTQFKGVITEHEETITKKFVTQDDAAASYAKAEGKFQDLVSQAEIKAAEKQAARFAEYDEKLKEQATANERLIKQLSARGTGLLPGGDVESRSLGERFSEAAEYKAWAAGDPRSRARLQLTVKGRIRPEQKAVTITEAGSGFPILPQRIGVFGQMTLPLVVRDLFDVVSLSGTNAIEYVLETWVWAADYQILEGDKKAQGDVTYTDKTATVKTIAWFIKASRQMLADAPYFASTINSNLLYGVAKKEEQELLFGNNAAGHLNGLMPQATTIPLGALPCVTYAIDQILAALSYLASLGFAPSGIVLNALDWAAMQIAKTSQGIYILGGPPQGLANKTLWGVPVVTSWSMTAGTFLVGAFPGNATIFDRETASVDVAYENEDDFVRNLVTFRCEERLLLAVYRPTAFVKGALAGPYAAMAEADEPKHVKK